MLAEKMRGGPLWGQRRFAKMAALATALVHHVRKVRVVPSWRRSRAGDRLALKALEQARRGIATNDRMSGEMRADILRDLDREIRELKRTIKS